MCVPVWRVLPLVSAHAARRGGVKGVGGLVKKKVVVADDGWVSILILTNTPRFTNT